MSCLCGMAMPQFWASLGQAVRQPRYGCHLPHWQIGDALLGRVPFAAEVDPENDPQEAI